MASEASWQTSSGAQASDPSPDEHPMDQQTVEALLRRLVERVEDSERRYGEALDELHTRLDHLSQTTEAALETGAPEDNDTFDRLHTQVSDLARRLERESAAPLDDFERLGKALSGGLRGDLDERFPEPYGETPEPSPFAQSVKTKTRSRLAPAEDLGGYGATPPYEPPFRFEDFGPEHADLDKRLVDMAERLEQSIGAAMPTSAIEALNSRLDEIGNQITESLDTGSSREALAHVEKQISDMGQQLSRAEEQLGKMSGVEEHLLKLIARLDEKDAAPAQPTLDPAQIEEIAAQAAKNAARLVADDTKKTTERLDAMQRELTGMSEKSRASGDKLAATVEAVHASLKQLVQQVEQGAPPAAAKPKTPFTSQAEAKPAAPFAQTTQTPAPQTRAPQTPAPKPQAPKAAAAPKPAQPQAPQIHAAKMPLQDAKATPRLPEMQARKPEDAEARVQETLRDRLGAGIPDFKDTETPPPFGRAKRADVDEEAVDLDEDTLKSAPDDLVAAARRAAQAAAARAEQRGGRRSKGLPGSSPAGEQPGRRKRSLLIVAAAILLIISALLLYGRLGTKPDAETAPEATIETAPPATTEESAPAATEESAPAEGGQLPMPESDEAAPAEPDQSWIPLPDPATTPGPDFPPFNGAVGQAKGVTDIAKSSSMPASEITPSPQFASLKPEGGTALPPGVIFSIEDPASASDVATAEQMTTEPVKGPVPPQALGPLSLRKAASEGDAAAQYEIAIRYLEGKGTERDPKMAAEWLERAARAGLAPAQYRLAAMYERGVGIEKSIERSRGWYAAAAERGNVKAMHNLAVSVSGREGNAPDYALAAKWYSEAAARGLADSQFNLGILAEHGLGRAKDLSEAYKWFSLAAGQGDPEAKKRRDVIRAQLAPQTLSALDTAVQAWTPMPAPTEANEVPAQNAWAGKSAAVNDGAAAPKGAPLVSKAQTLLNKLGYDVGPPDGLMGARTRTGIKAFQQRNGLEETGEVTAPLLTKLESLAS
jgi:localization factor PodJL